MSELKVHPIAAVFPMIDGPEFQALVEDIRSNGLVNPIVLTPDGSTIVDGRNRYRACREARIDPVYVRLGAHYGRSEIVRFIISQNIQRRHLTAAQRAMIGVTLLPEFEAMAKERMTSKLKQSHHTTASPPAGRGKGSAEEAGAAVGVGHTAIEEAKKVSDASPSLAAQVAAGTVSLKEAYKQVRSKPDAEKPAVKSDPVMLKLKTHEGKTVLYKQPLSKPTFNKTNEQVSWASWTWNPVTGCLHGCKYCYARELAMRASYKEAYPVGFTPLFHHERLSAPANTPVPKEAATDERQRRVFVCSMADLYGKWVPQDWIDAVHAVATSNPQWDYLMLTKFPRRYVGLALPQTAWIGTSVDEQKRVRIAEEAFRQVKDVRVKWLSLEPLLAPLQFSDLSMFDWIVIGSQTATDQPDGYVPEFAPPFEWVARIVAQAREAGCRVYLKPNLIGRVDPQSPGMVLPQEEPIIKTTQPREDKGRQLRLIAT
jgi:protein gp37/ParB-like chromosome segregation protein Spo0J